MRTLEGHADLEKEQLALDAVGGAIACMDFAAWVLV